MRQTVQRPGAKKVFYFRTVNSTPVLRQNPRQTIPEYAKICHAMLYNEDRHRLKNTKKHLKTAYIV